MKIRKVIVVLGKTQYGVLTRFAEGITEGFQELGIQVDVLDRREDVLFEIKKHIADYDMMFSFNNFGDREISEGIFMNPNMIIWSFYVDHPLHHDNNLLTAQRNDVASFIDRNHVNYVREMYPNNRNVVFLPHAGELLKNTISFEKRKYNITFLGSYKNPKSYLHELEAYDVNTQDMLKTIIVRLYREATNTLEMILAEELGKRGVTLNKEAFRTTMAELDFVDKYVRNKKRHDVIEVLLKAGYKVDVFGNGWEEFESEYKSNLCMHGNVEYDVALNEMANSRIVLNIMPLYANGSHERVFTVMGMRSICVTDSSAYLDEQFEDGKHLFYYSMERLSELPDLAGRILNNEAEIEKVLDNAYNLVAEKHLWRNRAKAIVEYAENCFIPQKDHVKEFNRIDYKMNRFFDFIDNCDELALFEQMKASCLAKGKREPQWEADLKKSFDTYPYWGKFSPQENVFEVLEQRAILLKRNFKDWIWLYQRLEDSWSKEILCNILLNWETMDWKYLNECLKERRYCQYFDRDIIQFSENEVFVDLGAYTGDTLDDFLKESLGKFKKVYCYECDPHNASLLEQKVCQLEDERIYVRKCAVGAEKGMVSISENDNARSGTHLLFEAEGTVEMVSLDEDIKEEVTFIKSDIEGAEYDAIIGAENLIRKNHPKLAISVYHGNKDLLRLPELIYTIDSGYKFYLRYYGGNLYPNEIVLYAI